MLTHAGAYHYASHAAAKSVAGFGDPRTTWRNSAHHEAGAFFMSGLRVCGGCAWDTFGYAGFQVFRFANLRTATPINCLATVGDGSKLGDTPMKLLPTRNLSARAAAHRAMAKAALFADSSTKTRLKRYNAHMAKARHLEAQEVQP